MKMPLYGRAKNNVLVFPFSVIYIEVNIDRIYFANDLRHEWNKLGATSETEQNLHHLCRAYRPIMCNARFKH